MSTSASSPTAISSLINAFHHVAQAHCDCARYNDPQLLPREAAELNQLIDRLPLERVLPLTVQVLQVHPHIGVALSHFIKLTDLCGHLSRPSVCLSPFSVHSCVC